MRLTQRPANSPLLAPTADWSREGRVRANRDRQGAPSVPLALRERVGVRGKCDRQRAPHISTSERSFDGRGGAGGEGGARPTKPHHLDYSTPMRRLRPYPISKHRARHRLVSSRGVAQTPGPSPPTATVSKKPTPSGSKTPRKPSSISSPAACLSRRLTCASTTLIVWCRKRRRPVDGESRSEYAVFKLRQTFIAVPARRGDQQVPVALRVRMGRGEGEVRPGHAPGHQLPDPSMPDLRCARAGMALNAINE